MPSQPLRDGTKLIVRVLQALTTDETFESYADINEALKCQLARLKIPWTPDLLTDAIDRLERGGRVSLIARPRHRRCMSDAIEPGLTRTDAKRLYERLGLHARTMK